MARLKIVKILFFVAALLFIARPFLGYALFNNHCKPNDESILVKIFSKRKPELSEESSCGLSALEKKPANPGIDTFSNFNSFLDVLFPAAFPANTKINNRFLREMPPSSSGQTWLLCKKLLI